MVWALPQQSGMNSSTEFSVFADKPVALGANLLSMREHFLCRRCAKFANELFPKSFPAIPSLH